MSFSRSYFDPGELNVEVGRVVPRGRGPPPTDIASFYRGGSPSVFTLFGQSAACPGVLLQREPSWGLCVRDVSALPSTP